MISPIPLVIFVAHRNAIYSAVLRHSDKLAATATYLSMLEQVQLEKDIGMQEKSACEVVRELRKNVRQPIPARAYALRVKP